MLLCHRTLRSQCQDSIANLFVPWFLCLVLDLMISFVNRILLGQSRDGIVFSTDDYFHHQDGYRYNVNQLGDAHDWNQNRGLFWAKAPGMEY